MKIITPLNILTTTIGLFFAHMSIADSNTPPARFYDKKDLPELSETMILPNKKEREESNQSFDLDRDALFSEESDTIQFETSHINHKNDNNALSLNITNYPVKLDEIDARSETKYLKITSEEPPKTQAD